MIDWQNIDTVFLDMDGTLLDLHFDNYFWLTHLPIRYAEFHKITEEASKEALYKEIERYKGSLLWYCLDHWSELIKMDIPALKKEVAHKIRIRPYAELFLQALQNLHKKVILITNAHPTGLNMKLSITQIDRWLDIVISSHEFKTPKEDHNFWQHLQKREAFDPARSVFFDDTIGVLRSAKAYGIRHLVCINQPDSQKPPVPSGEFMDICHFDEIMPPGFL